MEIAIGTILFLLVVSAILGLLLARKSRMYRELDEVYARDVDELYDLREDFDAKLRGEIDSRIEGERQDAIRRSRQSSLGTAVETFVPFMDRFKYDPKDARHLGSPIDMLVFSGLRKSDQVDEIVFVEIKMGKGSLSRRERAVKRAVDEKRVKYELIRLE